MNNPWDNDSQSIGSITNFNQLCRHPTILKTMFVGNCEYIDKEYKYIVSHPRYPFYEKLLQVHGFGNPERYFYNPITSGNTIHMVHHLARFEESTKNELDNVKECYEFGGGFGNMAEIIYKYSKSRYTIQDLSQCLVMQKEYLKNVLPNGDFIFTPEPINKSYDLFISTWALSECNLDIRDKVYGIIKSSKNILIAYAATFNEVDNIKYFKDLSERITTHTWNNFNIPTMDGNHFYLFGRNFYV